MIANEMKELETIRAEITSITAEMKRIKAIALPIDIAMRGLKGQFGEERKKFLADIETTALRVPNSTERSPYIIELKDSLIGWMSYVHGDALCSEIEALATKYREDAGQSEFMLKADRDQQMDALDRRLYDLEFDEERLVCSLGLPRRAGVRAAAIMGVPYDLANTAGLLK